MDNTPWWTTAELCQLLKCDARTLAELRAAGRITGVVQLGRNLRWPPDTIRQLQAGPGQAAA